VFLRPDADIVGEVRHALDEMPFRAPADIIVTVRDGMVTLVGVARPGQHQELVPATIGKVWDIDGVVDVVNRLIDA
jgi:osmotically-inducible protein OsmY